jgi:hypothetical protein
VCPPRRPVADALEIDQHGLAVLRHDDILPGTHHLLLVDAHLVHDPALAQRLAQQMQERAAIRVRCRRRSCR